MRTGIPYRVEHRLWQNATSVVYHGTDQVSGAAVLLRVLKLADDTRRAAWRDEVELLTRLRGTPGVAELIAPCEAWPRAPLAAYRFVELLASVRRYLAAFPDSVDPLLKVTEDALQVLQAVHAAGVVHGRLTPDALYVNSAGEVFLLDLGRVTSPLEGAVNQYGYRRRPEEAGPPEPQDDLYAWGMIMRTCLKGHPLDRQSEQALKARLVAGQMPSDVGVLPDFVKRSAKELAAFIDKLLQGHFASAEAALKGLRTFNKPKLAQEPQDVLHQHRIELQAAIGQGGMGTVYRCRFKDTGERVAAKVMLGEASRDRFLAEAAMLQKLNHPNIVRFRDLYDWEVEDETSYMLLMEYAPGLPIDVWFDMVGRDMRRLGDVFDQLLDALAYLHDQGYVHRDIKPQNMLVAPGGQLKLLDFGLVKDQERSLTRSGEGLGTITYMAPEQAREAAKVDGRADVYSAGVLLAKLLCGTGRFVNQAQMQTFESLFQSDGFLGAREQGLIVPGPVPPGMVAFLEFMVAADPKDRFQSARQAQAVWRRLTRSGGIRCGRDDGYPRVGVHNRTPALRQVWSNVQVEQTPKSVIVYGIPGVGKTRVLREAAGWVLVQGDADLLWANSLAGLGTLLAVEPTPAALATALVARASGSAVLAVVDSNLAADDDETETLLTLVGQCQDRAPLVLVGTAATRETLTPTDWRTPVRVEALIPHEIEALIKGMLSARSIDGELYDVLMAASGGIAGVLVKLLAALQENIHYVLFPDTGRATLKPFARLPVPDEALAFLRAQLDELEPDILRFVAGLGVMGETWPDILYQAWAADCFANAQGGGRTIPRRRIPFIETLANDRTWRSFSPRLMAHAAASLATDVDRKAVHRLAAFGYAAQMDALLPNVHDHAPRLVELCRERVRHLRGMEDDTWIDQAIQGADWAAAVRDFGQAMAWMNDAVQSSTDRRRQARCLAMRAMVRAGLGQGTLAAQDAIRALELAPPGSVDRLFVLSHLAANPERLEESLALLDEAVELLQPSADAWDVARVHFRRAWIQYASPTSLTQDQALSACNLALEASRAPSVPGSVTANVHNMRGLWYNSQHRYAEAEADFLALAASPHASGPERGNAFNNLGLTRLRGRADFRGAVEAYLQAIETLRRDGLPQLLMNPYSNLGILEANLGERPDVVFTRFETAGKLISALTARLQLAALDNNRGYALVFMGQLSEATDCFLRVLELVGDTCSEACDALCGLASVSASVVDRHEQARAWLTRAAAVAEQLADPDADWKVERAYIECAAMGCFGTDRDSVLTTHLQKLEAGLANTSGAAIKHGELALARALASLVRGGPEFTPEVLAALDTYERCELKGRLPNLALQIGTVAAAHRGDLDEPARAAIRKVFEAGISHTRLRGLKPFQKSLEALQRTFQTSSVSGASA